eukprot:4132163-Alexandrium_andersonii.AAC.1
MIRVACTFEQVCVRGAHLRHDRDTEQHVLEHDTCGLHVRTSVHSWCALVVRARAAEWGRAGGVGRVGLRACLLYTSPSPRD